MFTLEKLGNIKISAELQVHANILFVLYWCIQNYNVLKWSHKRLQVFHKTLYVLLKVALYNTHISKYSSLLTPTHTGKADQTTHEFNIELTLLIKMHTHL